MCGITLNNHLRFFLHLFLLLFTIQLFSSIKEPFQWTGTCQRFFPFSKSIELTFQSENEMRNQVTTSGRFFLLYK